MARLTRGALGGERLLHVTARAVDGALLLADDAERGALLALLGQHLAPAGVRVVAFCLMGTHVHLIVWLDGQIDDLSRAMRAILVALARTVNARRGRSGDLHRDRFHACPFRDDAHRQLGARYVERNPVAAGLVVDPAAWRWSSFAWLAGERADPPAFLAIDVSRELFGPAERYAAFVRAPDDHALLRAAIARDGVAAVLARGWPSSEVAAALGVPRSTFARRVARLRRDG